MFETVQRFKDLEILPTLQVHTNDNANPGFGILILKKWVYYKIQKNS